MEYIWLWGIKEGRPFRSGPYNADKLGESRAQSNGIQWCGSNFELFRLDTRDSAEAGRRIRQIIAERGSSSVFRKQQVNRPELEASSAYKEIRTKEINGEL